MARTRWTDDKTTAGTAVLASPCHVVVLPSLLGFGGGAGEGGTQGGDIDGNGAMRLKGPLGGGSG